MAFAARLRVQRRTASLALSALVASLSLGIASVPTAPAETVAPNQATATREFADTSTAKPNAHRTVRNRVQGTKPRGYDSRKARRRILMQMAGLENSGRQWTRLRRGLRRGPSAILLATPAWKLAVLRDQHHLRIERSVG